jgi:predicted nucleic acid-binding protein
MRTGLRALALRIAVGRARSFTSVSALVDTNVLVYRFDPRFPQKQQAANDLLRRGIAEDDVQIPHQVLIEFVAVITRPVRGGAPLLSREEAARETELLLRQFMVIYPTEQVLRAAFYGQETYQLSWFDAHLWAYAEVYGLSTLVSEDFQHGRRYGKVVARNPFLEIKGEEAH